MDVQEDFSSIPDEIDLQWVQSFHSRLKTAIEEQRPLEVSVPVVPHQFTAVVRTVASVRKRTWRPKQTCVLQEVLPEDAAACILARVGAVLDKEATVLSVRMPS